MKIKFILYALVLLFQLKVKAAGFTFNIQPNSQTVNITGSTNFQINVSPYGGYNASIFYSITASSCISSFLTLSQTTQNYPYTNQTLTFTGGNNANIGIYEVIIVGQNGAFKYQDTCTIEIVPSSQNSWTIYNMNNSGLSCNNIFRLKVDNEDNVWVGTLNNYSVVGQYPCLAKFDGQMWEVWKYNNHFTRDNCGNVTQIDYSCPISGEGIRGLDVDDVNKCVWIACGSVFKYDINSNTWTNMRSGNHFGIKVDLNGNVWCFDSYGLHFYNGNAWIDYNSSNSPIQSGMFGEILIDLSNNVWLSVGKKVIRYDGAFWTVWDNSNSIISSNGLEQLTEDDSGNIWGGQYNNNLIYKYSGNWSQPYSIGNSTNNVALKSNDFIWTASSTGIYKFDVSTNISTNYNCNNSPLPCGSTNGGSDNYIFTLSKLKKKNVMVIGGSMTGLITISDTNQVTSVQETTIEEIYRIIPNPAQNQVKILGDKILENEKIVIFDIIGNKVFVNTNSLNEIDISTLKNGIYFAKLIDSNGKIISLSKFVKID